MAIYIASAGVDSFPGTVDNDIIAITDPNQLNVGDLFDGSSGTLDQIEIAAPSGLTLTGQTFDLTQVTIQHIDELVIASSVQNSTIILTSAQTTSLPSIKTFGTGNIFQLKVNGDLDLSALNIQGLSGGSFTVVIDGDSQNNTLIGSIQGDTINGGDGNDTIKAGGGNDTINTGTGIDTADFSGNFSDYTISYNNDTYTIIDNRQNSPDGTDVIQNVEFLNFADQTIINKNSSDNNITTVENIGNIELALVNGFFAGIDKNTNIFTKVFLKGDYVTPTRFPARWSLLGVERVGDSLTGAIEQMWHSQEGEFYYGSNIDDGGHISEPEVITKEIDFQQDFNGDGQIFQQAIESAGNSGLYLDVNGNYVASNGTITIALKDSSNNNLKANIYTGYQIIGAELTGTDLTAIWKNTSGEFFSTTNSSSPGGSIALTTAQLIDQETEFTQDFNSDGKIGQNIETAGTTTLFIAPDGQYIANNGTVSIKLRYSGSYLNANIYPHWKIIGAEIFDNNNVKEVWKRDSGEFWYSSNIFIGESISGVQLEDKEFEFQQDFNGDGHISRQPIESFGTTIVYININGNYVADNGIITIAIKDINNNNVNVNTYPEYQLLGAEIIGDNVKSIWKNTTGEFYSSTNTATVGGSLIALTAAELLTKEVELQQDFNNDGKLAENIESFGTTTLFLNANGKYAANSAGSTITLRYGGGNDFGSNTFAGWKVIGAEIIGNEVKAIWKSDSGQFWYSTNIDNGVNVSDAQLVVKEVEFQQDFNNDGKIGENIEAFGTTTLFVNSNNEYIANQGSTNINLKFSGNNFGLNTFAGWKVIGAEIAANDVQAVWKRSDGQFWYSTNTNNGGIISAAQLVAKEVEFQQDLNGDGKLGGNIESFGTTILFVNSNGQYVANNSGSNVNLKYAGNNFGPNTYAGWKIIGAEIAANDVKAMWKSDSGQFFYSTNTNNGGSISGTQLISKEVEFTQDFNGDGKIGQNIESVGTTTLFINPNGEYVASNGTNNLNLKNATGNNVKVNTYPGYQLLGAEITGDSVTAIWKNTAGEFYSSTNTATVGGTLVPLTAAELITQEINFQQDFNGDGQIFKQAIEIFGTAGLYIDTNNNYVASNRITNINLKYGGKNFGSNTYAGWKVVGAEIAGTDVKAIWKSSGGKFWYSTNTNNGGIISSTQLIAKESEFTQDFNGDGKIGSNIESFGSTTLYVDSNGNYLASKGTTTIAIKDATGNNVKPDALNGDQILGAEMIGDDVKAIWKNTTGEYFTSMNTVTVGSALVPLTAAELLAQEPNFSQDFNNDGKLGQDIESAGGTTLFVNANGEYVANQGSTNLNLKYVGNNFGPSNIIGWKVIGAEILGNDVKAMWKSDSGNYRYATNTDTGVIVSGSQLLAKEIEFQQDFNGDGQIFQQAIETFGKTGLYVDVNGNYLASKGTTTITIKDAPGNNVNANTYNGYQILGAEITGNNVKTIWKNTTGEFFSSTNTATVGGALIALTPAELLAQEAQFIQDFNGDGKSGSNIESAGGTTLFVNDNGEYVANQGSTNINLKYAGKNFGPNTYGGWKVIGAEIVGNDVKAMWKSDSGQLWYSTNTNSGGTVSGAQLIAKESEFQQDFNGDNLITYQGTTGDDIYIFNADLPQANSVINETVGDGVDTLSFTGNTAVEIDLANTSPQNINANLVLTVVNLEKVVGGNGDDTIAGNSQNNIFTGGLGNDTFVFGGNGITALAQLGFDTISDFSVNNDKIRLDRTVFGNLNSGNVLDANHFKAVSAGEDFSNFTGIIYNKDNGKLLYGNTEFAQIIPDLQQLSNNDFILTGSVI
jgi:Tryptophan-rich Synechocystis species C-terminal domain/RTX calcium-binding nonapeptide repeat (4 copies)